LAARLPQIMADPTEIEQVLMNLIRNAVEAAEQGRCRLTIKTEPRAGRVRLTVSDDGPGIPPEKLPHIFDPFFTTRRGSGGTGLGLSIVHAIIVSHGGSIEVKSRSEFGTRFTIELPACGDGKPPWQKS
jgi:two-component system, NtrC family, sensor kinase